MAVDVVKLPNGDHSLGAEIEGVFVPFVTLSKGKVAQLVERAHNLAERAEEGDELARDQIGESISAPPKRSSSSKPKGEED